MIIIITNREFNECTGHYDLVASHGVDFKTLKEIPVSPQHPTLLGAVLNLQLGEYVIYEKER